jgi:hypothetical protein
MEALRKNFPPVTRDAFLMLKNWLSDTWKDDPEHPEIGKTALGSEVANVKKTLKAMFNSEWPISPDEYFVIKFPKITPDSAQSRASSFNRCMKVACRENHFHKTIKLTRENDGFRLAWFRTQRESSIKQILWLQFPLSSEFNSLLMLGALSMAKEFNLDLKFQMIEPGENLPDRTEEIVNQYCEDYKSAAAFRKSTAIVFEMFNLTDVRIAADRSLEGHHVITTGVSGADVTQDNNEIGMMLAKAICDKADLPSKLRIAILFTDDIENDRTLEDRVASFQKYINQEMIKRGNKSCKVKTIHVDYDKKCHSYNLPRDVISGLNLEYDIIASPHEDLTKWLLPIFLRGKHDNTKFYSMGVTPDLLSLMLLPDSPLRGMVGIDPYSYGRLIVRAAFSSKKRPIPSAKPIAVMQQDIENKCIRSYVQLLLEYPIAQLNNSEYAWEPLMKDFCPCSFGPDSLVQ